MKISDIEFVGIRPGDFVMGAFIFDVDKGEFRSSKRNVRITSGYSLSSTPVTARQFRAFQNAANYEIKDPCEEWIDGKWLPTATFESMNAGRDEYPVVGVSYDDACAFLEWFALENRVKATLPTEAQFEYAARAACACISSCHSLRTTERGSAPSDARLRVPPVRTEGPNGWGLFDMHGVLWQWCLDWYEAEYPSAPCLENPAGPSTPPRSSLWRGTQLDRGRVIRGGSFSYPPEFSACSNRHFSFPTDRNFNVGFRVCLID